MSRCAKCGATGKLWEWKTAPCALDRQEFTFHLCDDDDIARNREILELLGCPDIDATMAAYAEKVRATVVNPTEAGA